MFKDEAGEKKSVELFGLRAKLYSYKCMMALNKKKCKGVSNNFIKRIIQFDDYRECLFSRKEQHREMIVIRMKSFNEIYTEEINKIALSSDNDKRIVMTDGIHTLAYGHTNLQKIAIIE